uniref:Ovule protein n=1 Tax=Strongyloides stercoralis TaxID=6248 RepID=A0A0K0EK09_STRER
MIVEKRRAMILSLCYGSINCYLFFIDIDNHLKGQCLFSYELRLLLNLATCTEKWHLLKNSLASTLPLSFKMKMFPSPLTKLLPS